MTLFFYDLTPEVIVKAVEGAGLRPTGHVMALNSYENRVYDLKLENEDHVVVKFYRPGRWSREQIQDEHDFLFQLRAEEIPVCAPLEFDGVEPLEPGSRSILKTHDIYYAIWPRTGGRATDELNDTQLEQLGRLLGRIHNVGAAQPAPHRPMLSGESYGTEPLQYLLDNKFLPEHVSARYATLVQEVVDCYGSRTQDIQLHRIHGDCHLGNLLYGTDGWFFLDFDDFVTGPAVQDIWLLCPARDAEGLRQREVLLSGYTQFRDFDHRQLQLIEPLRALRYIRYAGWIARRWEDPAFPAAFEHFGSDAYWEDEAKDLGEQLEFIRGEVPVKEGGPPVSSGSNEPELTNKDFFWDWEE